MSPTEFMLKRIELASKIRELKKEYLLFLNEVSPKHWRSSGHYTHELSEMFINIQNVTQITKEEKEIDWVKNEIEREK